MRNAQNDFKHFASSLTIEWLEKAGKLLVNNNNADYFFRVILFGSAVTQKEFPNDLDIFVVCENQFIQALAGENSGTPQSYGGIWHHVLDELAGGVRLELLSKSGLVYLESAGFESCQKLKEWQVDLFFLPFEFFTSAVVRNKFSENQRDQNFYDNAFQNCLVYCSEYDSLEQSGFKLIQSEVIDETIDGQMNSIFLDMELARPHSYGDLYRAYLAHYQ